jgi:hypothetical protein
MRKQDIDHLLEAAVAKAIGVKLPVGKRRTTRVSRKSMEHAHEVSRAA